MFGFWTFQFEEAAEQMFGKTVKESGKSKEQVKERKNGKRALDFWG